MPNVPEDHPLYETYGWRPGPKKDRMITYVKFNTGMYLYFMNYTQDVYNVQATTVDAVFADEEPPVPFYEELSARLIASRGLFKAGFTATRGQQFWYDVFEKGGTPEEKLSSAYKQNISLYECLEYMDGDTNTHHDLESIQAVLDKFAGDDDMIKRRVFGRFILGSGKAFFAYRREMTEVASGRVWRGMPIFAVVDPGTGGDKAHPAGILIVQHDQSRNRLVVLSAWRGDGVETTSNKILEQLMLMRGNLSLSALLYDGAAADFKLTANQDFPELQTIAANKKRHDGFARVNSYLEAGVIEIPKTRPVGLSWWEVSEIEKLHEELRTVARVPDTGNKRPDLIDDLSDCLRYASMHIHIPVELVKAEKNDKPARYKLVRQGRFLVFEDEIKEGGLGTEAEYDFWSNQMVAH